MLGAYGISLLAFNLISHLFASLTLETSSWTFGEKFHNSARPFIILHIHKKCEKSGWQFSHCSWEQNFLKWLQPNSWNDPFLKLENAFQMTNHLLPCNRHTISVTGAFQFHYCQQLHSHNESHSNWRARKPEKHWEEKARKVSRLEHSTCVYGSQLRFLPGTFWFVLHLLQNNQQNFKSMYFVL